MQEQGEWRFAYEALAHVRSLRLFLFNSRLPWPLRCESLCAHLLPTKSFPSPPLVVCQWITVEDGQSWAVYVPVPFSPINHSVPFAVVAGVDHIEVKITLLSITGNVLDGFASLNSDDMEKPVHNNSWFDNGSHYSGRSSFSLTSDVDSLIGKQGFSFYCRNCSAKLTNKPISRAQALPSAEWRELADHWFGACCYSNGAHTKSLLAQFEELLTPATGVCLVGSSTCILHCNDLAGKGGIQVEDVTFNDQPLAASQTKAAFQISQAAGGDNRESGEKFPILTTRQKWTEESKQLSNPTVEGSGRCCNGFEDSSGLASYGCRPGNEHEQEHEHECGHHSQLPGEIYRETSSRLPVEAYNLASGFMTCSAFSSSMKVTEVNCHACSALIGVSTGERNDVVQLFKCHISSDPSLGPKDIYRFHTLERVVSNELLSTLEEGSSYRFIVRGLRSKSPLLQLVVINHDSWSCTGSCWGERGGLLDLETRTPPTKSEFSTLSSLGTLSNATNTNKISSEKTFAINRKDDARPPVSLEPVMKVMFRDTSLFNNAELRDVEEWTQTPEADDIYMLEGEAVSLARSLHVNKMLFPESCAAFQHFHISFLPK